MGPVKGVEAADLRQRLDVVIRASVEASEAKNSLERGSEARLEWVFIREACSREIRRLDRLVRRLQRVAA